MATVIDELIVRLGLDPSQFSKGRKEAAASFAGIGDDAERSGKRIQSAGAKMSDTLSEVQGRVLRLGALFLGGMGAKEFAQYITKLNIETNRSAGFIGQSADELQKWQGIAKRAGGSAEGITAGMSSLAQEFQKFSLTGSSSVIPYFRALGVNIADLTTGKMRPMSDIMMDLSEKFSKMDPARAKFFGGAFGFDDASVDLLMKGPGYLKKMADEQERLGKITKEDVAASKELADAWSKAEQSSTSLGRSMLTWLTPALVSVLNLVGGLNDKLQWQRNEVSRREAEAAGVKSHNATVNKFGAPSGFLGGLQEQMVVGAHMGYGWDWFNMKPSEVKEYLKAHPELQAQINEWNSGNMKVPAPPAGAAGGKQSSIGNTAGMDPEVVARLERMRADMPEGMSFSVTDGFRTYQDQARAKANKPGLAAMPGTSNHEDLTGHGGRASDLKYSSDAARQWMHANASKYDMRFPMSYEPWHIEPVGAKSRAALAPIAGAGLAADAASVDNSRSSSAHSETHIGQVVVHTQATDAAGVAAAIKPAIERDSATQQSNTGMQ